MPFDQIKKRDGRVVDFDKSKIESAIQKACIATNIALDAPLLTNIIETIIKDVESTFKESIPEVEDVQDIVENIRIPSGAGEATGH